MIDFAMAGSVAVLPVAGPSGEGDGLAVGVLLAVEQPTGPLPESGAETTLPPPKPK